jgi:hypothetical protein
MQQVSPEKCCRRGFYCFFAAKDKVSDNCMLCKTLNSVHKRARVCVECWPTYVGHRNLCQCSDLTWTTPVTSDNSAAELAGPAGPTAPDVAAAGPTPTIATHAPEPLFPLPHSLLRYLLTMVTEMGKQRKAIQHLAEEVQSLRSEVGPELRKRKVHKQASAMSMSSDSASESADSIVNEAVAHADGWLKRPRTTCSLGTPSTRCPPGRP